MNAERKAEQLSFLEGALPAVMEAPRQARGRADDALASARAEDLPESVQPLCVLLGISKVIHLIRTYGGTRVYLPKDLAWDHPLCRVLGVSQARLLCRNFAGDTIYIPSLSRVRLGARNRSIRRDYDNGVSARELATREGLSYRKIASILKAPEAL